MEPTRVKSSAPTIYSHTGLRGIAATYVAVFHLLGGGGVDLHFKDAFSQFFQWADHAVDLFFILSGFILNWVYLVNVDAFRWKPYMMARVGRILPLYYLTTLLFVPVQLYSIFHYGWAYLGHDYFVNIFLNMFLAAGIVEGHRSFNPPAWSISVEFFCYFALFPLLVCGKRTLASISGGLILTILAALVSTWGLASCYGVAPIPIFHEHWDSTWLARGIFGFSTGFFLCSIYRELARWKPSQAMISLVILIVVAVFLLVRFEYLPGSMAVYVLPLLVYFSAFDRGWMASVLRTRICQWLGERSYSIYLWHAVLLVGRNYLLRTRYLPPVVYGVVILAVILGVSEVSYKYFETPWRNFIRKAGAKP